MRETMHSARAVCVISPATVWREELEEKGMWEECSGLQVPKSHIPQSFWRRVGGVGEESLAEAWVGLGGVG